MWTVLCGVCGTHGGTPTGTAFSVAPLRVGLFNAVVKTLHAITHSIRNRRRTIPPNKSIYFPSSH